MSRDELELGEQLTMSVVCARTGVILLPAGTVLTRAHIDNLANREIWFGSQQEIAREQERIEKIFNRVLSQSAPLGKEKISGEAQKEYALLRESVYEVYADRKNWRSSKKAVQEFLETEHIVDLVSISTAEKVETIEQNALVSSIQVASTISYMNIPSENKEALVTAAFLADLGVKEIAADNRLKDHDIVYKNHPMITVKLLKELEPALVLPMYRAITQHHETLDGLGTPAGIQDVDPSAQLVGACYRLNRIIADTGSVSDILERFYALNEKYSSLVLRALFTSAFILPEKKRITVDGRKGVIEQHNRDNPDRPIVLVESDNDYRGYRYKDLTKDLTSFLNL